MKNIFRDFFHFVGLIPLNGWFKDKLFYFALLLGPIFCFFLSLFIVPHFSIENPISFFLTQLFLIAFPEEFFFRGFLLPYIKKYISFKWQGISLANIITAIAFACLHLFYHPFFWALGTFFPAIVFGYFREKHNSLYPAIFLHFFYNSCYLALFG